MDMIWTVLPFLALLACPLMMVVCLFGMGKMGGAAPAASETQSASQLPQERVAALQHQLQTIQAELTALQPDLAPAAGSRPGSGDDRLLEGTPYAPQRPA